MRFVAAAALLLAATAAAAPVYNFSVIATFMDVDTIAPLPAIGHFDLTVPTSKLIPDVKDFSDWLSVVGTGMLKPWEYVVAVGEDSNTAITVYDLHINKQQGPKTIAANIQEMHCTNLTGRCYALNLERYRIIAFDPLAPGEHVETVLNFSRHDWIGCQDDSSALDAENLVLYLTLLNTKNDAVLVAADLRHGTLTALTGPFFEASQGPYCFDPTLGLVSVGSSLGGVVAYKPADKSTTVLRKDGLWGLPGDTSIVCQNGILAVGVVDFYATNSPYRLVVFDFLAPGGDTPFHNSTTTPDGLHGLQFSQPPTRS